MTPEERQAFWGRAIPGQGEENKRYDQALTQSKMAPPAAPLDDPLSNMGNYWDEFNRRTNAGEGFSEVTRDVRNTAPYELLGAYQGVARTGIYGQNGVNNIMQNVRRSNALRRRPTNST